MLRLDRFVTLNLLAPFAVAQNGIRIPILMYHSISREADRSVHPYYRVVTTPEVFSRHMSLLAEEGYEVIGIETAMKLLISSNGGRQVMQAKPLVITFDDGFLDFYTNAFPILARYGFTATVFLPSSFIGASNGTSKGKTFLSWDHVRELISAGFTFGSHSVSHGDLFVLPHSDVEWELRRSKETIEERTGMPVLAFSYPYAFPEHNKEFLSFLRNALRDCGYSTAVTTSIGTVHEGNDHFFLRRIPVNDADDPALFRAKIAGGYDWMHGIQYAVKSTRALLGLRGRRNVAKWAVLNEDKL